MDATEFRAELDRRLAVIADPEYDDPAARDLPARDLLILLAGSVILIAVLLAWGYPW